MFAATRKCPTAVKDTQSLVNMIITSGILPKSRLINGHNDAGADVSKHALLLCLEQTSCRVSIQRHSLEANHAETKAASEALRSRLMWIINNRIQISNKINRATLIVNGYEARPASKTERPRITCRNRRSASHPPQSKWRRPTLGTEFIVRTSAVTARLPTHRPALSLDEELPRQHAMATQRGGNQHSRDPSTITR